MVCSRCAHCVCGSRRFDSTVHNETGRPMHERIKEHDRNIGLVKTHTSAVSENAHNTRTSSFIDREPLFLHTQSGRGK